MQKGSPIGPKSELNVTPLVDVVLVLLVICMVTMPVMMRVITIEVPEDLEEPIVPLYVPIVAKGMVDGTVEITAQYQREVISRVALARVLRLKLNKEGAEEAVFVDFEDGVPWEQVVSVMDTIKGLGKGGGGLVVALKKRSDALGLQGEGE